MAGERPDILHVGSRVLLYGLSSEAGAQMNFKAGKVVQLPEETDRFGIMLLPATSGSKAKAVKRMNLLSASSIRDRSLFLGLQTLHYAPEMRAARPAFNTLLQEDYGLLLLVSSFVTHPRTCLFQFGGYMGRVWDENWCYSDPAKPLALPGKPAPRLDAASSDMGLGRVLFAGGCGKHPRLCRPPEDFFKSAEVYDSLTNEWYPIADMPTRRHGSTACLLDSNVYVLGGMYPDDKCLMGDCLAVDKFCDVLDASTLQWSSLPPASYDHIRSLDVFERAAFFGAGVVGGRIVALLDGTTIAYNPSTSDGWRVVEVDGGDVLVGSSSCACTYEGELVVASGRPERFAKSVAAFAFSVPPTDPHWWRGAWRQLPDINSARVGGSLAVVHGRLYITGGVDEGTSEFYNNAERFQNNSWQVVPWFEMPRALHAHDTFALPHLRR